MSIFWVKSFFYNSPLSLVAGFGSEIRNTDWRQADNNLDRCLFPVCLIDGCAVKSDEMAE
jgi:hypothetical protein